MRKKIGYFLLNLDDWFAGIGIYFNLFDKNKNKHISILAVWGFNLLCDREDNWITKTNNKTLTNKQYSRILLNRWII